ncbi:unnamed protein product [Calypogeia fissa]
MGSLVTHGSAIRLMHDKSRYRSHSFDVFGRRRRWRGDLGLAAFGLLLISLLLLVRPSHGAVMSIDLGSEWMKVAVVNLKPGQAPISIALNEMSKRKSPALVAFSNGERLLGEEAAGIMVRYPERVYARARDMVGKPFEYVKEMLAASYLPYDIIPDERGHANIRAHDKQTIFTTEELLAMTLGYGRELAESHAKSTITDAVITVPAYFGQVERKGVMDAAQIAGITVLALANEHSGAALQYGIDKDFSNETRNVIFYDMGANSLYAALVQFSSYQGKDRGKTSTVNQFQVTGMRWDASLGGQTMEARLVEHFAQEFNQQVGGRFDVRKFPKAMAKLKKQVKRTKEILSANTEAPLSVEALHDDRDFRSSITRQKFEELCGDLWDRVLVPVKDVLAEALLTVEDLHAVELIGGATRVPKVQAVLSDFLGKKALDRHLDADEAIGLGSALHAANLSDRVKLNRKFGMVDAAPYTIILKLDGAGLNTQEDVDGEQILIPRLKRVPSKVFRTFKSLKEDFKVSLQYHASLLPPGVTNPEFAAFQIIGVTDAAKKYESYNLSAPIKTNLHFSLSQSGVLNLDKAETVVEVTEWYEVPIKNTTSNETTADTKNKATEEGSGIEEKGPENEVSNEESKSSDSAESSTVDGSSGDESAATEPLAKRKLRKRTIRIPLKIKDLTKGITQPLSSKTLLDAVARLKKLELKNAEKRKTAEAKNSLEAYIYATKDKLDSVENIETVSTEKQRDALREELSEGEDWLYMDGENASAEEFQKKLAALQKSGEEIFSRLTELEARPVAVQAARTYLASVDETLVGWEKSKPWIPKESIDKLKGEMKAIRQWVDDMEAKQRKLKGYEKPAFTSEEVYKEVGSVQKLVTSISKLPKPKSPKVEKSPEDTKTEDIKIEIPSEDPTAEDTNEDISSESEKGGTTETVDSDIAHDEL